MIVKSVAPAKGELVDKEFLFPVRVYYEDTDAGGIVYYANYLRFAERCRTEFIRSLGAKQQDDLQSPEKTAWVVRHCEADYMAPAVLDDELIVSCRVTNLGGVTATMHQEIRRGQDVLVAINIKVAHISLATKKPVRIPRLLMEKLV
ncbi:MAG: tol-pal system-associated acyl-CoA thioesterase [Alphaproteobacteria bacterium]|nr:tol-pal system-associated acyl-CoA thioesterase [Alphaproteobacteria bacterium]